MNIVIFIYHTVEYAIVSICLWKTGSHMLVFHLEVCKILLVSVGTTWYAFSSVSAGIASLCAERTRGSACLAALHKTFVVVVLWSEETCEWATHSLCSDDTDSCRTSDCQQLQLCFVPELYCYSAILACCFYHDVWLHLTNQLSRSSLILDRASAGERLDWLFEPKGLPSEPSFVLPPALQWPALKWLRRWFRRCLRTAWIHHRKPIALPWHAANFSLISILIWLFLSVPVWRIYFV